MGILIVLFRKEKNDNDWHQVYLTRAEKEQSEGSKNCLHRMSFVDDDGAPRGHPAVERLGERPPLWPELTQGSDGTLTRRESERLLRLATGSRQARVKAGIKTLGSRC